jgi:O-antigen ligase
MNARRSKRQRLGLVACAILIAAEGLARLPIPGLDQAFSELRTAAEQSRMSGLVLVLLVSILTISATAIFTKICAHRENRSRTFVKLGATVQLAIIGTAWATRDAVLDRIQPDSLMFVLGICLCFVSSLLFAKVDRTLFTRDTVALLLTLEILGLLPLQLGGLYRYHGLHRLTGLWDNPNTLGLLMALLLVISVAAHKSLEDHLTPDRNIRRSQNCLIISGALALLGLFASYSRGAWLAAAGGLVVLLLPRQNLPASEMMPGNINRRMVQTHGVTALLVFAALILTSTGERFLQRLLSVANENDFSWRNRVTTWFAGLQMAADQPICGWGWHQMWPVLEGWYAPDKLTGIGAIYTNDFVVLAIALGLPALGAFCWLLFSPIVDFLGDQHRSATCSWSGWEKGNCACSIVLAIGLFFDGGIYKFAIAVPLWVLIGLSLSDREPSSPPC